MLLKIFRLLLLIQSTGQKPRVLDGWQGSKERATFHAVSALVQADPSAEVQESSSHWLEDQSSDSQACHIFIIGCFRG